VEFRGISCIHTTVGHGDGMEIVTFLFYCEGKLDALDTNFIVIRRSVFTDIYALIRLWGYPCRWRNPGVCEYGICGRK
jgi:hypothetical protein